MIIEFKNGKVYDVEKHGLHWLSHKVPYPSISHDTQAVDGRNGNILLRSRLEERTITVTLLMDVIDLQDYYLLRDEFYGAFYRTEPFYITFKEEPYKRWRVVLADSFDMPPTRSLMDFDIEFLCVDLYAESLATTQSLHEWDVDVWAWNGQIDWDNPDDTMYTFMNINEFFYNNIGTVELDPREMDITIKIRGVGNRVQIENLTTGEVYIYNGNLTSSDVLTIDGIRTLKNGVSVFKDTNKRVLTYAVGKNNIRVSGITVHTIQFENKFYFM